jgi:hypothetical protein
MTTKETEFRFIDVNMIKVRKILKDLSDDEVMQLELIYQIKRIADLLENKII